jgi:hypothetical protein
MKRHDNVYAVVGTPESRQVIVAPFDKYVARTMREAKATSIGFYCSLAAGGCGGKLKLAAGDVRLPYFSHEPSAACSLTDSTVRDRYSHLALQEALKGWIERSTGLLCDLEVATADRKGRSDLVVRDAQNAYRLGLEVQLSPLTGAEMDRRSSIYLDAVHRVQWLYGNPDIQACQAEVDRQGYAVQARIDMRTGVCELGYYGLHGIQGEGSFRTTWGPLTDWVLQKDGLFSPRISELLAEVRVRAEQLLAERVALEAASLRVPALTTFKSLHATLTHHYDLRLIEYNAAVRKRVLNAIYRQADEGALDEQIAVEVYQWLAGEKWSHWWDDLLGDRRMDIDIVQHVLQVHAAALHDSVPRV